MLMFDKQKQRWRVGISPRSRRDFLRLGLAVPAMLSCGFRAPPSNGGEDRQPPCDVVWPLSDDLSPDSAIDTFAGTYVYRPDTPVGVIVASGRADSLDVHLHKPTECYRSNGFRLFDSETVTVYAGQCPFYATLASGRRDQVTEEVLFWGRLDDGPPGHSALDTPAVVSALLKQANTQLTLVRFSARGMARAQARGALVDCAQQLINEISHPVFSRVGIRLHELGNTHAEDVLRHAFAA